MARTNFRPQLTGPSAEPTSSEPNPQKTVIPKEYETELQTVFHALGEMQQPEAAIHWQTAGTQHIGVLVSDTLMFQRAAPQPSDENLGQFYGLALPLLMRGMPVEPVQIESSYREGARADFLSPYPILELTYEGQKPPSPQFHEVLAAWVKAGGALIVVDDDKDPYNHATDWWNSGVNHFATPRDHLFQTLGLKPDATGLHAVGKGFVLYAAQSPSALTYNAGGSEVLMQLLHTAAAAIRLPLQETDALVLRRGPYVIAAGLEGERPAAVQVSGDLIDLFDANLTESKMLSIQPGTRALLLDVDLFPSSQPCVLAASAKITGEHATAHSLAFRAEGIEQTRAVVRVLATRAPQHVSIDNKPLPSDQYQQQGRTLLLRFLNTASPQQIQIDF